VELKDLVGLHLLSGVDMSIESVDRWGDGDYFEDCQVVNFILDGICYTAIEDPTDDYRSCMRDIKQSDYVVSNTFEPIHVFGVMKPDCNCGESEILILYDFATAKAILSIGTNRHDEYYPSWHCEYTPENMAINAIGQVE
jgi:hypothetical protein